MQTKLPYYLHAAVLFVCGSLFLICAGSFVCTFDGACDKMKWQKVEFV